MPRVTLPRRAKQLGGSLTVKLFNGDITADANRGMDSLFYARAEVATSA
jgi:hypothetical protein